MLDRMVTDRDLLIIVILLWGISLLAILAILLMD